VFGTSPANGVSLPDFTKLAQAFDLNAVDIYTWQDWLHYRFLMNSPNPVLFNVHVDPKQVFSPKLAAKKLADGTMLAPSLEIMSPFLSDQEMQENQYQL
jgi:acetolactate synthase-1/2/3 large subunit